LTRLYASHNQGLHYYFETSERKSGGPPPPFVPVSLYRKAYVIKEGALQFAKDFPGYLHYNSDIDKWYASYKVKGMYEHDEYYIMNPMDIPDEYIVNKDVWKINFSGEFFQMSDEARESLQILRLGGQHYRFIYLSKIEKRE